MYIDDRTRLYVMLETAREALRFSDHKMRQDLNSNRLLVDALIATIEMIGEAAARITPAYQEQHPEIPWQRLIQAGHRLREDYAQPDLDLVWRLVTEDLPAVAVVLEEIVPQVPPAAPLVTGQPDGVNNHVSLPTRQLDTFCRHHHIRKLALFGSALRSDFHADSDIDLLVEFEPGYPVGLLEMAGMELELSQLLGRKVDLPTPGDLNRAFRQTVVDTAQVLYADR